MEMNGKKVAFHTLGCKLNFSETATIARDFKDQGFAQVDFEQAAEVYVINTCSVTHNADKECKLWIRKAKEANPDSLVVIVGCYAQLQPEEIAAMEGVDLVLGATEKFKITDYLDGLTQSDKGEVHSCEINEADFYVGAYSIGDRTRAFLKVQDGCDYKCTYCTIPLARGISRSDTLDNVLANARMIVEEGAKEIVLTGVNIGDYGKGEFGNKRHEHTFLELVQALDEVEGIDRFRISSIEPNLLKNETIEFVAQSKRFVPHFHIPLQSGSNKILKKMKTSAQRCKTTFSVEFCKHFLKTCVPTLGQKRQKGKRFARDVLRFATFCNTSRLKVPILTFCTRSRAGALEARPQPTK